MNNFLVWAPKLWGCHRRLRRRLRWAPNIIPTSQGRYLAPPRAVLRNSSKSGPLEAAWPPLSTRVAYDLRRPRRKPVRAKICQSTWSDRGRRRGRCVQIEQYRRDARSKALLERYVSGGSRGYYTTHDNDRSAMAMAVARTTIRDPSRNRAGSPTPSPAATCLRHVAYMAYSLGIGLTCCPASCRRVVSKRPPPAAKIDSYS